MVSSKTLFRLYFKSNVEVCTGVLFKGFRAIYGMVFIAENRTVTFEYYA